jgi:YidC/Oxa1 family membrane protein insertase
LLNQKQLELYKKYNINPLAGCLPTLIQMPIWMSLYQMLWNSVELYQQPFYLWIRDLTAPDPLYILPICMGLSMFMQNFFQPVTSANQKYILWGSPIFLTIFMIKYNLPSGLILYILTNNIYNICQQVYIKNTNK